MSSYQIVIIGAGLSGLAAGIRAARFGKKVLIVEQHSRPGGLNSWYMRNGFLLETGLHAMTNYAPAAEKQAPLNRLFRQLKLPRKSFITREQFCSEINFPQKQLGFSNDIGFLKEEICQSFPHQVDGFLALLKEMEDFNPFLPSPWRSARSFLSCYITDSLLSNMLLLPLMVYGNAEEEDMDLSQFAIMFRALFLEGFFRPENDIKQFLEMLLAHYQGFGGEIVLKTRVSKVLEHRGRSAGVVLADGSEIVADQVLSTIGIPGTMAIMGQGGDEKFIGRMSFMETVSFLPASEHDRLSRHKTIIFYSRKGDWHYKKPEGLIDPSWGVICFPDNFTGIETKDNFQLRVTNAANYDRWFELLAEDYADSKAEMVNLSGKEVAKVIGDYGEQVIFQDSFSPLTIYRYTFKEKGAVYGSPIKWKDGTTSMDNLFIAGTDQGFLGIVGSMLSGVSIVNQHLLTT